MYFHSIPSVYMSAVTFRWKMPYSGFIVSKSKDSQTSSSRGEGSSPELGLHSPTDTIMWNMCYEPDPVPDTDTAVSLNLVRF